MLALFRFALATRGVEFALVDSYKVSFADHGTSSKMDLGVWAPTQTCTSDGWYSLGDGEWPLSSAPLLLYSPPRTRVERLVAPVVSRARAGRATMLDPERLPPLLFSTIVFAAPPPPRGSSLSAAWCDERLTTAPHLHSTVAVSSYSEPKSKTLLVRAGADDPTALAVPTALTLNWSDKKGNVTHGSKEGGLFTPVCPKGYTALGSVGIYHTVVPESQLPMPADVPLLRCVKSTYATAGCVADDLKMIWDDDGSGCDYNGTVWAQPAVTIGSNSGVMLPFLAGPSTVMHGKPAASSILRLNFESDAVVQVASPAVCVAPAGVHVAIGTESSKMNVQWTTYAGPGGDHPIVQWGTDPAKLIHFAPASTFNFTSDPDRTWWNHVATMAPLAPGTVYYYRVGNLNPTAHAAEEKRRIARAPCVGAACTMRRRRRLQEEGGVTPAPSDDEDAAAADTRVDGKDKDEGGDLRVHAIRVARVKKINDDATALPSANDANFSQVFHFRSQVTYKEIAADPAKWLPQKNLVMGDMGAGCAFTLCPACTCDAVCDASTCATNHSSGLVTELANGYTHILQTGDFAYNMDSDGGLLGDQFMANIEQVAAFMPFMVNIGNHENSECGLAHYTERFRLMPSNSGTTKTMNGEAPNNWFFSWDDGLVHWVTMNSEIYFESAQQAQHSVEDQWKWLEQDLIKANKNRENVPWISVQAHRSIYCSCDGDCDGAATLLRDGPDGKWGMEQLLFDQGVDFFLNGHEHNYERNWPTYQNKTDQSNVEPKAPIYIVTGAAGCSELHEPFTRPQPARSAFRSNNFGYSRMIVHNHTHVRWQQVSVGGRGGWG